MMNIRIKKVFNQNGIETGAILSVVIGKPANIQEKNLIESQLVQYAFTKLYPGEGLIIFQEIYIDTPAITVIKNIDELGENIITI